MDSPATIVLVTVLWQSSLCLGLGLVASVVFRRRPARAHGVLLCAVVAAVLGPLATVGFRSAGWGVLPPASPIIASNKAISSQPPASSLQDERPTDGRPSSGRSALLHPTISPGPAPNARDGEAVAGPQHTWTLTRLVYTGWSLLSGVVALRMLLLMVLDRRLVREARRVKDPAAQRVLDGVARRLRTGASPEVRVHAGIRSPMIWSWQRPPILLFPEGFAERMDEEGLAAVVAHELAHYKRRDHLAVLLAATTVCLLPWQPLAWWAARRLAVLSEHACDAWALSSGCSAPRYAELLLGLAPRRRSRLALAGIKAGGDLGQRLRLVLDGLAGNPSVGGRSRTAILMAGAVVVAMLACAQPRGSSASARGGDAAEQAAPPVTTRPATTQPDPAVTTEQLRTSLDRLTGALEGLTLEYTWKQYRGNGPPPDDPPTGDKLHLAIDHRVVRIGDAYRDERLTTDAEEGFGYGPGTTSVVTWNGWVQRELRELSLEMRENWGARYRDHTQAGTIFDDPWNRSETDRVERLWQGIANKLPRRVDLAAALAHPSLRGPFVREDGRVEWQVVDPEEWRYDFGDRPHTYVSLIAESTDEGVRLAEIRRSYANKDVRSEQRLVFSREVFSDAIPIPVQATERVYVSWVGRDPYWSITRIDLNDARRTPLGEEAFFVEFDDGTVVDDTRYGVSYVVGGRTIDLIGRGTIATDEPVRGDVGERLAEWLARGSLVEAPPPDHPEAIGVQEMDLPESHVHDRGESEGPNWGTGLYHVFTVTNETDRTVTIIDIRTSGKALRNVHLGWEPNPDGGVSGVGTTLEPGESTKLHVGMSFGAGKWRHGVTLVTDAGEQWHYQLSVTGVFEPVAEAFFRRRPDPESGLVPMGLLLFTRDPETEPLQVMDPRSVELVFERWITLAPYHFLGGSPIQQIAHFTLDMTEYQGEYPCSVKLRTAAGVEFSRSVPALE